LLWRAIQADEALSPVDWAVYLVAWGDCPGSMVDLADRARVSRNTARRSCARLAGRGWLKTVSKGSSKVPTALVPEYCQAEMARRLLEESRIAAYKGEFLMRRYLDWCLVSNRYIDNARPAALISPITQERLELDRLYLDEAVGFEYNGPQHYRQTDMFNSPKAIKDQQTRDILKKGLSLKANITLVIITADQLHPDILEIMVPPQLKRRPVDKHGPYYQAFASLSVNFTGEVRSWSARKGG